MQTCSWRTRPRALPRTRHRVSPCGCPRAGPRVRLAPRSRPQQRFRSRLREHGRGVLHQVALSALPLLGAACDSGTTAPRPALVVVTPATSLLVGVGATIEFAVDVTDANGSPGGRAARLLVDCAPFGGDGRRVGPRDSRILRYDHGRGRGRGPRRLGEHRGVRPARDRRVRARPDVFRAEPIHRVHCG